MSKRKTKKIVTKTSVQHSPAVVALLDMLDTAKASKSKIGRKAISAAISIVRKAERTLLRDLAGAGKREAKRAAKLAKIADLKAQLKNL